MIFEAGARIGAYQLIRHCGGGAYGEVFVAENTLTGERLALKVLHPSSRTRKRELEGLIRCSGCHHPHLIRIRHVDEVDGCLYYTMDLADDLNGGRGEYLPATLAALLERRKRLPAAEAEQLFDALADALAAMHGMGLVHRDVKPENILWVNGNPVLGDPGLTAAAGRNSLVGTPEFMSPEQLRRKDGAARPEDDFYALRRVIYCAFTGEPPSEYPHCPAGLLDDRSAALWRRILEPSETKPAKPASSRRRVVCGAAVAVSVLLAAATALFVWNRRAAPVSAPPPPAPAELLRQYRGDDAECEALHTRIEQRFGEFYDRFRAAESFLIFQREFGRLSSSEFAAAKGELARRYQTARNADPLLRLRDLQSRLEHELAWSVHAEKVSGPTAAAKSARRLAELFAQRRALLREARETPSAPMRADFPGADWNFAAEIAVEMPHFHWDEVKQNPKLRAWCEREYPARRTNRFLMRIPAFDLAALDQQLKRSDTRLPREEQLLAALCKMSEWDEIDRLCRGGKVPGESAIRRAADLFRQNRLLVETLYRESPKWRP